MYMETMIDLFRLNLQSQTWMTIESMRNTRACFGSVAANGKIYVAGGLTNGTREDNRSVEVYDIESNTWSLVCLVILKFFFLNTTL